MINQPPSLPFDLDAATKHLCACDKTLAELIRSCDPFRAEMEAHQSPYEALLEAIAYQSISGKAAATIFGRVKALSNTGGIPTPQEMLKLRPQSLRKAGLSGAKVLAMKDLAKKTVEGIVPTLEESEKLSDEELVKRLVSVRGIGAWTVEMFLIFRLGRPDVLPIHDYGVQKGFALTYGKRKIPKPRELAKFGERWRPYRTVASWYMWRAVESAGKAARKITKGPAKKKVAKNSAKPGAKANVNTRKRRRRGMQAL